MSSKSASKSVSKSALPFIFLGVFLLGIDGLSILVGSVPVRYGRGVRIDELPEMFWLVVGIYLLAGVICIGIGVWKAVRR